MPQPIDPNTELSRMSVAERLQELSSRASVVAQVRQRVAADEQQILAESQVQQAEAQSEAVDENLQRRNPFMGQRRHQEKKKEHKAVLGNEEAQHLDISI